MPRKPTGDRPLTPAERQAHQRAKHKQQQERLHVAMKAAYDSLHDDNDADSAERILRVALQGSANHA